MAIQDTLDASCVLKRRYAICIAKRTYFGIALWHWSCVVRDTRNSWGCRCLDGILDSMTDVTQILSQIEYELLADTCLGDSGIGRSWRTLATGPGD